MSDKCRNCGEQFDGSREELGECPGCGAGLTNPAGFMPEDMDLAASDHFQRIARDIDGETDDDLGTDGGTVPLAVGEFATDREQTRDQQDTVVVVNRPGTVAREDLIDATGRTVYSHNQQYGYSSEAAVIEVSYVRDMDAAIDGWREVAASGFAELVREVGVSTYSFPEPRLERVEDAGGDSE